MPRDPFPPPADLDADSRKLWKARRKQLEADDLWHPSIADALERYVRACERARLAREGIPRGRDGRPLLTAEGSKGQVVQHPNVKTAREAERDAHEYAGALLLTPEARRRHDVKPKAPGKFAGALG